MQFKSVPTPPDSLETLASLGAALPADVDPAVDCRARVIERILEWAACSTTSIGSTARIGWRETRPRRGENPGQSA